VGYAAEMGICFFDCLYLRDDLTTAIPGSGSIHSKEISALRGLLGGGGSRHLTCLRPTFCLLNGKQQGNLCDYDQEQPIVPPSSAFTSALWTKIPMF
jgi:hypothetical protein